MKNNVKFVKRYGRERKFAGQHFTGKSVTIPGQDMTPQEIIRRFRSGVDLPQHFFTEYPISNFDRMNTMEKLDFLKDLKGRNHQAKEAIDLKIKDLQKQQQIEQLKLDLAQRQQQVVDNSSQNAT